MQIDRMQIIDLHSNGVGSISFQLIKIFFLKKKLKDCVLVIQVDLQLDPEI